MEEIRREDILPFFTLLKSGLISPSRSTRMELVTELGESIRRCDIAQKRLHTLMLNLATKGEYDITSREKFIRRLGKMSGLLGAKAHCLEAKEAGIRWILEDERTLNYLNLDHMEIRGSYEGS